MTKRQEEMTRKKHVRDLRGQIQSLEGDLANMEDTDIQVWKVQAVVSHVISNILNFIVLNEAICYWFPLLSKMNR